MTFTLHDLAVGTYPVGIECSHCMRRVLLTREQAKAKAGDRRLLDEAGLRCNRCGSRSFQVTVLHSRSKMRSFLRN